MYLTNWNTINCALFFLNYFSLARLSLFSTSRKNVGLNFLIFYGALNAEQFGHQMLDFIFFFQLRCAWEYIHLQILSNFCLKETNLLTFPFLFFQVDLEPEGKVFVVITLTGNFTEGKGVALACFHSELDCSVSLPSVPEQCRHLDFSGAPCCGVPEVSWVMGEIWKGLLVAAGAVCALCCDLRPGQLAGCALSALFPWSCPSDRLFLSLVLFTWLPLQGQAEEKAEHV